MSEPPKGQRVSCPDCAASATAVIPGDSAIVESEEDADGAVRVNCHECGTQFLVHYRVDE